MAQRTAMPCTTHPPCTGAVAPRDSPPAAGNLRSKEVPDEGLLFCCLGQELLLTTHSTLQYTACKS
jgi:hypothetical protein